MKRLYVGNLPWAMRGDDLRQVASTFGEVVDARVILEGDGERARSRGFGFVEFAEEGAANRFRKASEAKLLFVGGRDLRVKDADPKQAGTEQRGYPATRPASFDR